MTYGVARAATSPELALYRTPGKRTKWRAAIFQPTVVYTARINQTFSSWDGVLSITYDTGSGSLPGVLPDMTLLIGSSAGAHDIGIVRIRASDATHFYIGETSDVTFADNQYLTVIDDFGLWARHVLISAGVSYMDGGIAYSDQHANPDPTPIMGSNRVLKLTGASVSAQFDGSASYVVGGLSSISSYAWQCGTASSSSGTTTATPTFTFNSVGCHLVYLVVTAANGKSYYGVRYVFVWNDDNPLPRAQIGTPRQDVETGGWEFELTLLDDCDVDTIRDHTLVILVNEDQFGSTQSDIGPVAGAENIEVEGWIARESINWNPEQGFVRFTAYTAHYWFGQIPAFPDGVEFTTATPSAWTEFQDLTVPKGVWHFIHWRTTATRIMDVFLPDDTKYTKEVSSLASNLWEQIREMAFLQIYARAGVNAWNQLSIQVHPQLVPYASRTWATVMTITKADWQGEIDFERITKPECAVVSLSGVAINASGVGASYFSLSPGHAYPHYGSIDVQDKLLVSGQSQANQLAGLYRGWRNNQFPEITISLAADIRLIDCFPNSKCAITIDAADTPRGIAYSGNLIPTAVSIVTDPETGYVHREVTFEAETFELITQNGDIPGGRADTSVPPTPSFPPLPDFPVILPGGIDLSPNGAVAVITHDTSKGLIYTENFDATSPSWRAVNAGLTAAQYQAINKIVIAPNGAIYVAYKAPLASSGDQFIAYAPSIGGTFTILEDLTSIAAKLPGNTAWGVCALGVNPLNGQVGYVIFAQASGVSIAKIYIGSGTTFAAGGATPTINSHGDLSYGFGNWRLTAPHGSAGHFIAMNSSGSSIIRDVAFGGVQEPGQVPVSTTDKVYMQERTGLGGMYIITNNGAVGGDFSSPVGSGIINQPFGNSAACDPTGAYIMLRWDSSGKRGKSSDYGTTWSGLPSLPVSSAWCFANAGDGNRWAAVAGSMVRYSPDFGNSWYNKEGNITSIAPIPSLDIVKVVGF